MLAFQVYEYIYLYIFIINIIHSLCFMFYVLCFNNEKEGIHLEHSDKSIVILY